MSPDEMRTRADFLVALGDLFNEMAKQRELVIATQRLDQYVQHAAIVDAICARRHGA